MGSRELVDPALMAHELTHVVQQREGVVGSSGPGMSVGASDTAEEHEADGVADAVMQRVAQRHSDDNDEHASG